MVPHLNIFLPWSCLILISLCLLWNLGVWFQNLGSCFLRVNTVHNSSLPQIDLHFLIMFSSYILCTNPPSSVYDLVLILNVWSWLHTLHKSSLFSTLPCPDFRVNTLKFRCLNLGCQIRVHNLHKSSLLTYVPFSFWSWFQGTNPSFLPNYLA